VGEKVQTRAYGIVVPLLLIFAFSSNFAITEMGTTTQGSLINRNTSSLVKPKADLVINQSQTWYGNFIVNDTDTVVIENCSFVVENGYI